MLQSRQTVSTSYLVCRGWSSSSFPQRRFLNLPRARTWRPSLLLRRPSSRTSWWQEATHSLVRSLLNTVFPAAQIQSPAILTKDVLSKEQLLAVETKDSCVRVVAGPGSGKTRVLTNRVMHLLSECGVLPHEILFITFTNKAAKELRDRIVQLFGPQGTQEMMVGTFHSFCAKLVRRKPCFGIDKNFVIYDQSDSEKVMRSILKATDSALRSNDAELERAQKNDHLADKQAGLLTDLKNLGFLTSGTAENRLLRTSLASMGDTKEKSQPTETVRGLLQDVRVAKHYKMVSFLAMKGHGNVPNPPARLKQASLTLATLYEKALRRNNAVDFDDIIHLTVQLLHNSPEIREECQERWKYVLVDEFQDTDKVQYELIRLLTSKHKNLFVVGDIDQAIFGWRGAEFRHMQKSLEVDFPDIKTFQLRENYRSSPCIVKAASIVLKNSLYDRRIGSLQALSLVPVMGYKEIPIGIVDFPYHSLEANFIVSEIQKLVNRREAVWGSFALLYRTRAQSFQLGASLSKAGIPYTIMGTTPFYSDKEVKLLISYLQFISNGENEVALEHCLNKPTRGIGEKSVEAVKSWASLNNLSFPYAVERIYSESITHKALGIRSSARVGIFNFMEVIHDLREMSLNASLVGVLRALIHRLKFEAYMQSVAEDDNQFKQHLERLHQLLVSADIAGTMYGVGSAALSTFLQDLSLLANHEESIDKKSSNDVKLLTMHSSKGLEFDCVFLVGASDNLIPLEDSDLDEERRLFYVGITRARKRLYLTHSRNHLPWQDASKAKMSRFVKELMRALPKQYFNLHASSCSSSHSSHGMHYYNKAKVAEIEGCSYKIPHA